jgi:alkylation response protein AidB-like acyl-CoA dehydrogenase
MEFDLSDEQRMMQQAAHAFLAQKCPPEKVRQLMADDQGLDAALWRDIAQQGWTGMVLPERLGGLELGTVELAVVAEEMGRVCLPGPFVSDLWAAVLLARCENPALSQLYVPEIAAGERHATVALLEDSAEWDPAAVSLSMVTEGDTMRLNGEKHLVGDAAVADPILCVVRGSEGLTIVCLDASTEGVASEAQPAIDQTRKLYRLSLNDVSVPASQVAASGAAAQEALAFATQVASVAVCAEMLGLMQWVLVTSVEYVKTRKQFGKAVGSFQAVQHQCADMVLLAESAKSATYYAAWALSVNDPCAAEAVSIAKAYCSDAAREVGNRGIQVHGGIGFTWEHDLHLYYKRAKSNEILFGDAEYHYEQIARMKLDGEIADVSD